MNDNYTPDWDGALVVKDQHGTFWYRNHDGSYRTDATGQSAIYIEEFWGPITVVTPAPAPEPRTLTWRRDGTGCTWDELVAEFREGRQAERVTRHRRATVTHRGPLELGVAGSWWIGDIIQAVDHRFDMTSITVWLPEEPEVPEWAQDCDNSLRDWRIVVTDDGRVWVPRAASDGAVASWVTRGGAAVVLATDELAAMGARLIVDRYGRVVEQ